MGNSDTNPMRRLLYAGMAADYGDPGRGVSFEERNFHHPLRHMGGLLVSQFDFMANGLKYGVKSMSQQLLDRVRVEKPDLLFMVLFDEEHDSPPETVREITETTDTATLVWICDDHWKFADYSRHWTECLDWIVTTDHDAIPKYRDCGLGDRAIHTMRDRFSCRVGYSGHEIGLTITTAAVALGATSIERHVTLDRSMWGSDQHISLEPEELRKLVSDYRLVEESLGDGQKVILDCEREKQVVLWPSPRRARTRQPELKTRQRATETGRRRNGA